MREPHGARTGPLRPHTTPVREFCKFWCCQLPYVPVRAPYGTFAGPARAPYGSRRIWRTFEIPMRGPYDARTGTARGPCGVLRIIWSNYRCTAVSTRTWPVAWCDHENSTGVKSLRALHSALWARNRTGVQNRTGPVDGCDWGIRDPDMHHGMCVTHVAWCMLGSLTSSYLWSWMSRKTFPAIPSHAQPAILCIW